MDKKFNVAIIGATGNTGRKILSILDERDFPVGTVHALASRSSKGKQVSFGESKILTIGALDEFDFKNVDIVFSCVDAKILASFYEKATSQGAIIIDKSSMFRLDDDVPLVVPEVNEHLLFELPKRRIISSPNCCVIPLVTALAPLNAAAKIKRIIISTYQSVSGAGKEYMDELYNQTKSTYMADSVASAKFERQIAFNIIPKIDNFSDLGDTGEETKIILETQKILGKHIGVSVTCVRVPVFIGHSLSVNVEFEQGISPQEAEELLSEAESIAVFAQDGESKYITPVEVVGEDMVYVSRIRRDDSRANSLNLWVVADNLRKGAATNAVQIAEAIIAKI